MSLQNQIQVAIEALTQLSEGLQAFHAALGGSAPATTALVKRGPGRPAALSAVAAMVSAPKKPRKKAPRQLCPVPGCKNPAAPVYGMVCKDHKDVPKAKIKKYREARRAKKAKE